MKKWLYVLMCLLWTSFSEADVHLAPLAAAKRRIIQGASSDEQPPASTQKGAHHPRLTSTQLETASKVLMQTAEISGRLMDSEPGQPRLKSHLFYREPIRPAKYKLTLETTEAGHPLFHYVAIFTAALHEYQAYALDHSYRTLLLKNTNYPNTMLVDGIRSLFPLLKELKTFFIGPASLTASFQRPLNMEQIMALLEDFGDSYPDFTRRVESATEKTPRKQILLQWKGRDFAILEKDQMFRLFYAEEDSAEQLRVSIELFASLITRVHQDFLFDKNSDKVFLAEYVPILKLIAPEEFEDILTRDLGSYAEMGSDENLLKRDPNIRETRISKLYQTGPNGDPAYYIQHSMPHVAYVLLKPRSQKMLFKINSQWDFERIAQWAEENKMVLNKDPGSRKPGVPILLQKGGGHRSATFGSSHRTYQLKDSEERIWITFEGSQTLSFALGDEGIPASRIVSLVSELYYKRLFFTGFFETPETGKPDLSAFERAIIGTLKDMVQYFNYFMRERLEREMFERGESSLIPSALEWIETKMLQSPYETGVGRLLYALEQMDQDEIQQRFLGMGPEIRDEAREYVQHIQMLKKKFRFLHEGSA